MREDSNERTWAPPYQASRISTSIPSPWTSSPILIPPTRCCVKPGPVVYLDKWNVYGGRALCRSSCRPERSATFCSSRGVGLSDFTKEKPWRPPSLILEADPPAHTRTRAVLNRRCCRPAVMKQLRDGFAAAADAKVDELLERRSFDAVADLAEAYPLSVFPDAIGTEEGGPRTPAALCRVLCSMPSVRPTSCARTPSNARRPIGPMSPRNASATISRPAVSAPASMRGSTPATSPPTRRRCWCARCCRQGWTPR